MVNYEAHRFGLKNEITVSKIGSNFVFGHHFHRSFELLYNFEGTAEVFVGSDWFRLSAGEFVLIFPNQIHAYNISQAQYRLAIFAPEYINTFYKKHINLIPERPVIKASPDTHRFISENLNNQSDEFMLKACLYALCSEAQRQTVLIPQAPADLSLQHKILSFIQKNFTNDITLSSLAREAGYDYQYLSRLVKAQFKKPFTTLLNEHRISLAAELLKESSDNIDDIAFKCGFNTVRSFNRNFFDILGTTPSDFRLQ